MTPLGQTEPAAVLPNRMPKRLEWARWATVLLAVVVIVGVFLAPTPQEIRKVVEAQHPGRSIQWTPGSRVAPAELIVDGRDISSMCAVTGGSFTVENVRIDCGPGVDLDWVLGDK